MAFPWAAIAVVASAGKAYAAYYEGMAKKAYYDAKADLKLLETKDKRIESKEAGVKVLEETNKAISAIIAKGGAGGILPDEGTIVTAQLTTVRNGVEDFNITQINQEIIQNLGIVEYKNLKEAGKVAKKAGIMSAIFGFGTDMATLGQTGAFDKKGTG